MFTNFREADKDAYFADLTARDVVNSLTLDDVKRFLESLGVEQIEVNREKEYLICPTICHNPLHEAESMKLYWYHNYKTFHCYTECSKTMSIYELYMRYMELNYYPITFDDAKNYVELFLQNIQVDVPEPAEEFNFEKYKYDATIQPLKEYSEKTLDCFINYYHPLWLKDGITKESMNNFNIKFSVLQNKIIIPHYDIEGRLIGIRGRAIEENDLVYGKYMPIIFGGIQYNHSLSFNLYGINKHKEGIISRRSAIIVEAEKSVLLSNGYYNDFSNVVACCGSNINKYHISLLTNILGATEITIALDKEYDNWNSNEAKIYRKKIVDICNNYNNLAHFSYIWDYENLLDKKDSPLDKGKDIFEHLYKNRVHVR